MITFVTLDGLWLREGKFGVEGYVAHVEHRVNSASPAWEKVPGESGGEGELLSRWYILSTTWYSTPYLKGMVG